MMSHNNKAQRSKEMPRAAHASPGEQLRGVVGVLQLFEPQRFGRKIFGAQARGRPSKPLYLGGVRVQLRWRRAARDVQVGAGVEHGCENAVEKLGRRVEKYVARRKHNAFCGAALVDFDIAVQMLSKDQPRPGFWNLKGRMVSVQCAASFTGPYEENLRQLAVCSYAQDGVESPRAKQNVAPPDRNANRFKRAHSSLRCSVGPQPTPLSASTHNSKPFESPTVSLKGHTAH